MLCIGYDLLSQLISPFWLSWLRHYLSFLLFLLSWFLVLQALLFSPILANLLIPNVLEYIYEPPISKGYVCVSDISYVCICWFDNPNSKSHKLKYVYYLKHWYVHKWLLQVYQHNGQLQSFGADCWLQTTDCQISSEQLLFVPEETWVVLAACQLELCKNKGAAAQPT